MVEETMENLGFTKQNSAQSEDSRKKEMAEKFIKLTQEAKATADRHFQNKQKEKYEEGFQNNDFKV
jgi:hypothetical protein